MTQFLLATGCSWNATARSCFGKIFPAGIAILLLAGCGASRANQCRTLTETIRRSEGGLQAFDQERQRLAADRQKASQQKDFAALQAVMERYSTLSRDAVSQYDQLSQSLQAIELQDETLQTQRRSYVQQADAAVKALSELSSTSERLSGYMNEMQSLTKKPSESAGQRKPQLDKTVESIQKDFVRSEGQAQQIRQTTQQIAGTINRYCQP